MGKNDLVIALISGGGSALMPYPAENISLLEKQTITGLLIASGAEIVEINTVRKHLSQVKGGRLVGYFSPAKVVALILSDAIGNDLSSIASGLTAPDPTTFSDAYNVLKRYHLLSRAPKSVVDLIRKGCLGQIAETPKKLDNCYNHILGDNRLALKAMADIARETGHSPHIITTEQKGDATETAQLRVKEILDKKYDKHSMLLIGGETTVTLPGNAGKGGRNQHYAAVSMISMADYPGEWVIASVGTDGSDFLPDVAGAIVDGNSLNTVKKKKIDAESYLVRYDSYNLLDTVGNSLIMTGDTGTNVGDVIVYLKADSV